MRLSLTDGATHEREDVAVTRKKREAVVTRSLDDFNSIRETLHLQKSPENARRLRVSIEQLNAGEATERR